MLQIHQIPVLKDNYIFLLHDSQSGQTAVVDPAEAQPVLAALQEKGWTLTHILNTHYHGDHVGGNQQLQKQTACSIIGARNEREPIPGLNIAASDGDVFTLGESRFEIMAVPGHTKAHIAFWFPEQKLLFCGDTVFSMGCGRLLGGTAEQLMNSLQRIRKLPPDTQIYCAHEYTLNNGRFAVTLEPGNRDLQKRLEQVEKLRQAGQPTVPFKLQDELATNPFLRPESPEIRQNLQLQAADNLEVFTETRRRKDTF